MRIATTRHHQPLECFYWCLTVKLNTLIEITHTSVGHSVIFASGWQMYKLIILITVANKCWKLCRKSNLCPIPGSLIARGCLENWTRVSKGVHEWTNKHYCTTWPQKVEKMAFALITYIWLWSPQCVHAVFLHCNSIMGAKVATHLVDGLCSKICQQKTCMTIAG